MSLSDEIESMVITVLEFGFVISKGKNENPVVETCPQTAVLPTDLKCKSLYIITLLVLSSTYFLLTAEKSEYGILEYQ